jgi:hypothetical protein
VCSKLLVFDSEGARSLLCDLNWAEYAVRLGYEIGSFDKKETRVVACITGPKTPLLTLLIAFGCLLAADHSESNPDLVTFNQFMDLDETQQLYWIGEKKGKQVIIQGYPGESHEEYGGGRWVHQKGGRSLRTMVFKQNFYRFQFQFSSGQARQVAGDTGEFYKRLGVQGIRHVFSSQTPRVVSHGKKAETISLAKNIYLCVDKTDGRKLSDVLNISESKLAGKGATRLWADREGVATLDCHTALISSSRNFENLVGSYGSSNVVFLFDNAEFTDHALSLISNLSGTTPEGFPEAPDSMRCRLFEIKRQVAN